MSDEDTGQVGDNTGDSGDTGGASSSDGGESLITSESEGGNPLETWRDSLPVDLKNDPSLVSFKDVEGLAKSYVHAQKMIGHERISVPRDDWSESDWEGHYTRLGRPDTYQDYETPKVDLPEGFEISEDAVGDAKKTFHELGLSSKQAEGLLEYYLKGVGAQASKTEETRIESNREATDVLKEEWGREYNHNLDIARGALKKFGSDELISRLEATGMGNDPNLIRAFSDVGKMIVEDDVRGGRATLEMNGKSNAMSEINNLKGNPGFMEQLFNRNISGHDEAKERWEQLHKIAFSESA